MEKTWLDELQPGDKVVFHHPEDRIVEIRFVHWNGTDFLVLTVGAIWFDKKNCGYSDDRSTFLSPYYPGLENILPVRKSSLEI